MALIEVPRVGRRVISGPRIACGLLLAALALLPAIPGVPSYWITLLIYVGLSAIVCVGLVVLTGMAGITSFGQAIFVGIGAYASAVVTTKIGYSGWIGLPCAIVSSCVVAWIIGQITLRLSGHFLPLATISWNISFFYLLGNLDVVSRYDGIAGIPPLAIVGHSLTRSSDLYYLTGVTLLIAVWLTLNLIDSRVGRSFRAIKGGIAAAESVGIDTARARMVAFVFAAALASVSGWLYAHVQRAISPAPFGLNASIEYLLMVVVGGAGSVWGALAGAGVVTILRDSLQDVLPKLHLEGGNYEIIGYGVILLALLQTSLGGIWSLVSSIIEARPSRRNLKRAEPLVRKQLLAIADQKILAVSGLTKMFGGLTAVDHLDFNVRTGEILGLIGPNGAGKSTTFGLITGQISQTAGSIELHGIPISGFRSREIAGLGVARTFQHVKLAGEMTVLENVMLGCHLRGTAGVPRALFRLAYREEVEFQTTALDALDRLGARNLCDKRADTLALGQQRIVELARALCLDPTLLFIDEPAAGLRYHEKQTLRGAIMELKKEGVTIVLVEHDMEFVMDLVDRLVVMNFGSKLAEGDPKDIRNDSRVIDAYLGVAS
jgi:branched-chain amino acid transport system permease protein